MALSGLVHFKRGTLGNQSIMILCLLVHFKRGYWKFAELYILIYLTIPYYPLLNLVDHLPHCILI